jgi:hypothetical protein
MTCAKVCPHNERDDACQIFPATLYICKSPICVSESKLELNSCCLLHSILFYLNLYFTYLWVMTCLKFLKASFTLTSTVHFIGLFKDFQQSAAYTCNSKVLTHSSWRVCISVGEIFV